MIGVVVPPVPVSVGTDQVSVRELGVKEVRVIVAGGSGNMAGTRDIALEGTPKPSEL